MASVMAERGRGRELARAGRLSVRLAAGPDEVEAAQRLRWRVFPLRRLAVETLAHDCDLVVPPLIRGYLRAGARLLGEPHVDVEFGCVDFPVLLSLEQLGERFARRFVRA